MRALANRNGGPFDGLPLEVPRIECGNLVFGGLASFFFEGEELRWRFHEVLGADQHLVVTNTSEAGIAALVKVRLFACLLYTSPSPRDS